MITEITIYSQGEYRFDPRNATDRIAVLCTLYPRLTSAEVRALDQSAMTAHAKAERTGAKTVKA